jgi:hypothetical protein
MSDERFPAKCPSCQGEWALAGDHTGVYHCNSFDICRFEKIERSPHRSTNYLIRVEEDGSEIWWWDEWVEVKFAGGVYRELYFQVPLDMTIERLKTLLPFA